MGFVRKILIGLVLSVLLIMVTGVTGFAPAQNSKDSVATGPKPPKTMSRSTKATLLATFIPGSGQAYNHKYWKIPIAYLGYAFFSYRIVANQKNYQNYKNDYIAVTDTLESTINQSGKSASELLLFIDGYRRLRDLTVLGLLAWHGLAIIDANVDSHLLKWDVGEDLSLRIRPVPIWVGPMQPGVGLSLILNCK